MFLNWTVQMGFDSSIASSMLPWTRTWWSKLLISSLLLCYWSLSMIFFRQFGYPSATSVHSMKDLRDASDALEKWTFPPVRRALRASPMTKKLFLL